MDNQPPNNQQPPLESPQTPPTNATFLPPSLFHSHLQPTRRKTLPSSESLFLHYSSSEPAHICFLPHRRRKNRSTLLLHEWSHRRTPSNSTKRHHLATRLRLRRHIHRSHSMPAIQPNELLSSRVARRSKHTISTPRQSIISIKRTPIEHIICLVQLAASITNQRPLAQSRSPETASSPPKQAMAKKPSNLCATITPSRPKTARKNSPSSCVSVPLEASTSSMQHPPPNGQTMK